MEIYKDSSRPTEERVKDLLSRMTLEEKAAQMDMTRGVEFATKPSQIHKCSVEPDTDFDWERINQTFGDRGVGFVHDMYSTPQAQNRIQRYFLEHSRLGIPVLFTGEALHGIGGTRGTIFPVPLGLGATFDPALVKEVGEAIGRETRSLGIQEILAPNLDVAREPRWGRTEETFGEDTCLSSQMAAAIVSGEQKDGHLDQDDAVITEPKHYVVHGIAEAGLNCASARVGEREVRSVYLPVFESAVHAGACNVMASYNNIDGDVVFCSHHYLTEILKKEMGASGYVRGDWGGLKLMKTGRHLVTTDKEAVRLAISNGLDTQGCDLDNQDFERYVVELVREGKLSESRIDDAVSRILTMKFRAGLFEHPYTDEHHYEQVIRCDAHKEIALKAARESVTLLKNGGVLPIDASRFRSIAVIGPSSARQKIGGYSSSPTGYKISSVYEELSRQAGERFVLHQCDGCAITEEDTAEIVVEGQPHLYQKGEEKIEDAFDAAVQTASSCDLIVFVGGDNTISSGEGRDRCQLILPGRQRELLKKLSSLGKPMVLVLENGRAVDLSEENQFCQAIVAAWFGGEFGAQAIVEVLLGKVNPAGRIPVSFPSGENRIPCYYSMLPCGAKDYLEGPHTPLYSFGHGLSYTSFEYSDLQAEPATDGRAAAHVSVKVKNTGDRDGEEVVQVYVNDVESSVETPDRLLKEFKRVEVRRGEEKEVSFDLTEQAFRLMGIDYHWHVEPGDFQIMVGSSSEDIRLSTTIRLGCAADMV